MGQKLQQSNLILLAIIGFISYLVIHVWTVSNSDMDLGIQQVISKQEALNAAEAYLQTKHQIQPIDSFVTYQASKELHGYLNKNQLSSTYKNQYGRQYPLDYYQIELVGPMEQTYYIDVHMMDSTILGWSQMTTRLHSSSRDLELAKAHLESQGYNLMEFILLTNGLNQTIIFENQDLTIGEAIFQIHIQVHNENVISFKRMFKVPSSYLEWLQEQDQSTTRMSRLSLFISLIMTFIVAWMAIKYRKHISFSRGLLLTFVFVTTSIIHNFNMYPAYKATFAGQTNSDVMILFYLVLSNAITIAMAILVYLALVTGDTLWRLDNKPLWTRWRDRIFGEHVLYAMGNGYLFAVIILGIQQIIFFIGGEFLGVWSIHDPLFSNHNIWIPFLFPLLAWAASISEEAIYRLFGIIIFKKLFKNTFIAVLIPSMIWAMGHTQYPIYPAYTRFIEVTILGLIFGFILLKYGFITAIFAHISVNSILMGLSLMGIPGGMFHSLMGLFYIASSAIIAFIIFNLHRRFWKSSPGSMSDSDFYPLTRR